MLSLSFITLSLASFASQAIKTVAPWRSASTSQSVGSIRRQSAKTRVQHTAYSILSDVRVIGKNTSTDVEGCIGVAHGGHDGSECNFKLDMGWGVGCVWWEGEGGREGRSCRIPLVGFSCLHVPEGHAFWGRRPGGATTASTRLSARGMTSPSPRFPLTGTEVNVLRGRITEAVAQSSHAYHSGSSAMFRNIPLRSCRLSSPARLPRRAYSVSASSDAEAFLKPAGSSHPGVTYLSLNRPKTKNAISVNLLQVRCPHSDLGDPPKRSH